MKHTMTILATALVALAVGCARPAYVTKSDAAGAHMRGRVAQIRETLLDNPHDVASLPDTLGLFDIYTEVDYNRAGNITRMDSWRGPDSLHFASEEFLYDPSGQRMERSVSHNPARHTVRTIVYNYDSRGWLSSEIETVGIFRTDFTYNRRGYLRREVNRLSGEKKKSVTRYTYNRRGLLTGTKGGGPRKKYSYHSNGTVSTIENGNEEINRYDERGNLVSVTQIITSRDDKNRITDKYPVTISAEYEYDSLGNWVRRVQLYQGQAQTLAVRQIDYYDQGGLTADKEASAGEGARR